ncbi:MAG: hypothetical protein IT460_13035 [Planctomycetes bacterium]|nr:hypothetical protein [Planctomycetota bacterium]
MKVALPKAGPGVRAPAPLVSAVVVDLLVGACTVVAGALAAVRGAFPAHPWFPWALAAFGAALVVTAVASARMHPAGLTWRRRLGYVALLALAWRRGPLDGAPAWVVVLVVVYVGATWVALVLAGRALSRAIAVRTGEDHPADGPR